MRLRAAPRRIGVHTPPAFPGQRIGVMGGSFNPPHAGHLLVALTALKRLDLDWLWWVVTPGNPLKAPHGLASLTDRLEASRRLASHPRIAVTSFEAELGCSYTDETLGFLKSRFPLVHFVWIMGGDNLASFDKWRGWRQIAATVPLAIVDRPGWRLRALSSKASLSLFKVKVSEALAGDLARRPAPAWSYLSTRLSPLSSTALRQKPDAEGRVG